MVDVKVYGSGLTLGMVLAAIFSLGKGNAIGWVVVHFFCSWLYVIYAVITQ
jgi:hypothetical protein